MAGFPLGRILMNGRQPIRKPSVVIIFLNCTNHFNGKKICVPYGGQRTANGVGLWCQAFMNFQ
eukprot:6724684-Ditylum_brightwellii.AAC.1